MNRNVTLLSVLLVAGALSLHAQHFVFVKCAQSGSVSNGAMNAGDNRRLLVGTASDSSEYLSCLFFELDEYVPYADQLVSARLFLIMHDAPAAATVSVIKGLNHGQLPWKRNNGKRRSEQVDAGYLVGSYQVFAVTATVQKWLKGTEENRGLVVHGEADKLLTFHSKESDWPPYLQLEFTVDPHKGDLHVEAHDRQGQASRNLRVFRYDAHYEYLDEEPADITGQVEWISAKSGSYNLELYDERPSVFPGGTFLASATATVRGGTSIAITLRPDRPHCKRLALRSISSGTLLKKEEKLLSGGEVGIEIAVQNGCPDSQLVRAHILIDRDKKKPFDAEATSQASTIVGSGAIHLHCRSPRMLEPGTYSLAVEIQTFVNGTWVKTDAREWDQTEHAITIDALSFSGKLLNGATGEPVRNAVLALRGPVSLQTVSKDDGTFLLNTLVAGQYTAIISKEGFHTSEFNLDLQGNRLHEIILKPLRMVRVDEVPSYRLDPAIREIPGFFCMMER